MTNEEIIEMIRCAYSREISRIAGMREAVEKFAIDGTPIPQEILDERERLKNLCNEEIQNTITN